MDILLFFCVTGNFFFFFKLATATCNEAFYV